MYQYRYETLHTGGGFWVDNGSNEHRNRIASCAAEGWQYVGFVPSRFSGEGGMKEIDLVFEQEIGTEKAGAVQYQYETLHTGGGFWIDNGTNQHREIIDRYAAEGWQFGGFVPSCFSGRGGMKEIDLIFKKRG